MWAAVLAHRPRILALARGGGCDPDQARDVAQEALLRAAVHPDVDLERVGGLLTVIARRLVVDQHRRHHADARLVEHRALRPTAAPSHEDRLCDQAEGAWAHTQALQLPDRDRTVLLARADGSTPTEVAVGLGVTVKAVECVARRARLRMRTLLATTWALAALACVPLASATHPPVRPPAVVRALGLPGRTSRQAA